MKRNTVLAYAAGLATPLLLAAVFLVSGGMPVATHAPSLPFEEKIARLALHAKMGNQDEVRSPVEMNEMNLSLGAKVYTQNCAVCHTVPDGKISAIGEGLFPNPPQLFRKDENVTDDSPGKIFWVVKNGIRLTGMPSFVNALTENEMWQVSLLLQQADKLPEKVKNELRANVNKP